VSNNAASNVIPMRDFDRPSPDPQATQFGRLLKECQDLALERASRAVATMLEKAEEALWGIADQTQDRELRGLYISAKDNLISRRKAMESDFRTNYESELARRADREGKSGPGFSQFDLSSSELGLVNDEDLEETLKVGEMAAKLRRYCEEELDALDQRVGVLLGDATLHGEDNPFSPQALCNAYKQTCRELESNIKIRMIFHKLFDDHVLDEVRSIYKDINTMLIQRSILPKIRFGMRRGAGGAGVTLPGAALAGAMPLDPSVAAGALSAGGLPGGGIMATGMALPGAMPMAPGPHLDPGMGGEQDLFSVLQSLLVRGGRAMSLGGVPAGLVPAGAPPVGPGAPGAAPTGAEEMIQVPGFPPILGTGVASPGAALAAGGALPVPARLLQGAELIGSLTRLQHGDVATLPAGLAGVDLSQLASGTTNVVRELKDKGLANSVDQTDGVTLDIVAMLFDQIFGDERVPPALKALIGRMQIPVVKVAVLDKKFFSKKSHPARRMLDALGEYALGLDEKFDQSSPVYRKIEEIVQRLLEGFEDDIEIFETLHDELTAVIQEENARAELAAAEAARKIAYKERLEVGKAVAELEVRKRAETTRIPRLVLKFLVEHWVKLLLLAHARHGKDSDAWKSALQTMDLLIWSVTHKKSVEERRRLATMLPGLLKRLHAGLRALGTEESARTQFLSRLMRLHTKVISGASPQPSQNASPATPSTADQRQEARVDQTMQMEGTAAQPLRAPVPLPGDSSGIQAPPAPGIESQSAVAAHPMGATSQKAEGTAATTSRVAPDHTPSQPAETAPPSAGEPHPAPGTDEDAEPAVAPPSFSNVTIKNPFGEGDIEVEEISLADLPGVSELAGVKRDSANKAKDQEILPVTSLKEGDWIEFRDDEGERVQAKLSYISPLKGTYLFVNRQGVQVGEYSLYQLARELRTGRAVVLESVPLIDRAMSSLVGVLKKNVI